MKTSLCCDAEINEQFHICGDCGEHAEPLRFTDGEPVKTDANGMVVYEQVTVDKVTRPLSPLMHAVTHGAMFIFGLAFAVCIIFDYETLAINVLAFFGVN